MTLKKNREQTAVMAMPLFYADTDNTLIQKEYAAILKQALDRLPAQQWN